jgi:hypothetical protein
MRFRSKLIQSREASEPTLTKIREVYMTPDGRVEGKDQATNALEGHRLEAPNQSLASFKAAGIWSRSRDRVQSRNCLRSGVR